MTVFRLGLMALDGCMLSSLADPPKRLSRRPRRHPLAGKRSKFESTVFSVRGASVTTDRASRSAASSPDAQLALRPRAGAGHQPPSPARVLTGAEFEPELAALRACLRGTRIARRAAVPPAGDVRITRWPARTTSWWLASAFRRHFPAVQLEEQALVIEDGNLVTTGHRPPSIPSSSASWRKSVARNWRSRPAA